MLVVHFLQLCWGNLFDELIRLNDIADDDECEEKSNCLSIFMQTLLTE